MPVGGAHAVSVEWCAGEISVEQRPPKQAGFFLPENRKTSL
jgi:hypothetical protein